MPSKLKMTGLRLTEEQNYKIRYIAEQNHRKINDEFKMIVENYIKEYESKNGIIQIKKEIKENLGGSKIKNESRRKINEFSNNINKFYNKPNNISNYNNRNNNKIIQKLKKLKITSNAWVIVKQLRNGIVQKQETILKIIPAGGPIGASAEIIVRKLKEGGRHGVGGPLPSLPPPFP